MPEVTSRGEGGRRRRPDLRKRSHLGTFVPAAPCSGGRTLEASVFTETALEPLR
jgi:hypothetical protein